MIPAPASFGGRAAGRYAVSSAPMPKLTPAREAVFAGVAVMALHALLRITVAPGAFQDDAIYLGLGKALAGGEGWRSIYAAGQPIHDKYPPGLPLIYALAWLLGRDLSGALPLVETLHLAVAGLAGGLLWWIMRSRLALGPVAALAGLFPLSLISVVDHFQLAIAEGPFVAAWLAAIGLALGPLSVRRAVALGLLLATTALLRTQGLAVLAAVLGSLLLVRRDRPHVIPAAVAAIVPSLAWWTAHAWLIARGPVSTQPDEASYLSGLGIAAVDLPAALARTLWINVRTYANLVPRELGPAGLGHAIAILGVVLAVAGAARARGRLLALSSSLGLSLALVLAWPYTQTRFILALLPLAAPLVLVGWQALAAKLPRRAALGLACLIAMAMGLRQVAIRRAAATPFAAQQLGFQPVGRTLLANTEWMLAVAPWVWKRTPPTAHIFTEGAAGVWLVTGRAGVAALPATPNIGSPDWNAHPGGYLGGRIVADSITVVVASSPPVFDFVRRVEQQCPGTLTNPERIGSLATGYQVTDSGRACLHRAIRGGPGVAGAVAPVGPSVLQYSDWPCGSRLPPTAAGPRK